MTSRGGDAEFANPILEGRASGWSQEGCAATMQLLGMGGVEKEGELVAQIPNGTLENTGKFTAHYWPVVHQTTKAKMKATVYESVNYNFPVLGGILSKRWKEIALNNVPRSAIAQQGALALHKQKCQAQGE